MGQGFMGYLATNFFVVRLSALMPSRDQKCQTAICTLWPGLSGVGRRCKEDVYVVPFNRSMKNEKHSGKSIFPWGKCHPSDGATRTHSLIDHMTDVAAVMHRLLCLPAVQRAL